MLKQHSQKDLAKQLLAKKLEMELLTTHEVAKEFKLSASMLNKRRGTGVEPRFVKLGTTVRYRRADVVAWVEKQLHTSTSEYSNPIRVDGTPKKRRGRPPRAHPQPPRLSEPKAQRAAAHVQLGADVKPAKGRGRGRPRAQGTGTPIA